MSSYIKNLIDTPELLDGVVEKAFKSVDTDNSGSIDEQELEKVLAQISSDMGAEPPTKEDVKEVLEELDEDHNGTIEMKEFKMLIKDILKALIE